MTRDRLQDLLQQFDINTLKTIAHEHGMDGKNTSKANMINALARELASREQVRRALDKANPAEREILAYLQRAGGSAATGGLKELALKAGIVTLPPQNKDRWGNILPPARQGNPRYHGKPTLDDAAARLALLGLAFSADKGSPNRSVGWELGARLIVPREIRSLLPAPEQDRSVPADEPAHVSPGSSRSFQHDLARYWSYVRRTGKLDLTAQGYVYKRTFIEVAQTLGRADVKKADEKTDLALYFLRRMLVVLNLLTPGEGDTGTAPLVPGENRGYWSSAPAERVRAAFQAYLDTTEWNELRIPKATFGIDHRRPAPDELKQARRVIADHLRKRGADGWVRLADLANDVRLADYEFLFTRPDRPHQWYEAGAQYVSPYYQTNNPYGITYDDISDESTAWDRIEGAIITHVVAGPLHWLGLTDIGFDQDPAHGPADARAYRLTAMGAWLLGIGAPVTIADEGGRVVVQPNFQIVAMEPIAENVLIELDEFTRFEGGDHALMYRLTRESVFRAQRSGWDAARIIAYLEKASGTSLPQNVRRSLEEWQALHERITFRRGVSLVQAENDAALDEVMRDPALAALLGRRIGAVTLPDRAAGAVAEGLRRAGWFPLVTRGKAAAAPSSLVADEEGNVTFLQRAPSIYAYAAIEPFAERVDAHRARITPATVAAAASRGHTAPEMLTQMQDAQRGEIPVALVRRVKAWAGYYGDAKLGTLTLIEFRDEAARTELLADPELGAVLTRFIAGDRPLALVRAGELERVRTLLAERGVEIRTFE